jgi:L-fuculose-phosphate aldolase
VSKLKLEVIRYSKKLNITNLSALRSGNISVRVKEKGVDGFYITPSGMKYSSLKTKDIVFVSLKGIFDKKKNKPSSEWRFHQDM